MNKINDSLNTVKETMTPDSSPIAVDKPATKANIISTVASRTTTPMKKVEAIMECFNDIIRAHLSKGIPFSWPGLLKMNVIEKKATPERTIKNHFTKEEMLLKAKPAYKTVRVKALKKLKSMADEAGATINAEGGDLA